MERLSPENLPEKERENIYFKSLLQMFGEKFSSEEIENLYKRNTFLIQKNLYLFI